MKAKRIICMVLVVGIALTLWKLAIWQLPEAVHAGEEEKETVAGDAIKLQQPVQDGGLTPAAENDRLRLYFDHHSGGVAVEDKASGNWFYSNPADAGEDPKASEAMKQELMSQIKLVYNVKGKEGELEMNSYTHAMKLNQLSWGKLEQGLRVSMVLGREEQRMLLPQQITKSSLERNILEQLENERDVKRMLAYYILYTREDLSGANGKELLAKYPILEEEDMYVLKSSITDRDKRLLEDYAKQAGYTFEQLEEDYARVGYDESDAVFPYFKLSLDYILEDEGLSVTVHNREIEYDRDRFRLVKLSVLNYFGAGRTGEQGYLFLPDGSGTIIPFNNDAGRNTLLMTGKVYGPDHALSQTARGSFTQQFRVPVFGVKKNGAALFSVIEEGDAVAEINGMMGDINHSWNTAYASFTIRNRDTFIAENAFEQAPWILYEKNEFTGNIVMRYYFLAGEDADYSGMAAAYRQYLIGRGLLSKVRPDEGIPFYLDTMGSVDQMVRNVGIPTHGQAAVTSFEEAGRMLEQMSRRGIRNIKLRYTGWFNGGYNHTVPDRMNVEKVLGGEKGLKQLASTVQEMGAQLYPDVNFATVPANKTFDGFVPRRDGIRTMFQKISYKSYLNVATLETEKGEWVINPLKIPGYYSSFGKDFQSLGLNTLSVSTLGETLNSNFKNRNEVNRQQSLEIVDEVLAAANETYSHIISDHGNAYLFPYADHILNLPDEDSSFAISDRPVPFLQITLHGYMPYAGKPLNLANDFRPSVLKALEYGSGVYFKLNYGDNSLLKGASLFDQVHASQFFDWEEKAAAVYKEMNEVLKDVQDQAILNHQQLEESVYKTVYENGKAIIVNYSDREIKVEGVAVGPEDYAVIVP